MPLTIQLGGSTHAENKVSVPFHFFEISKDFHDIGGEKDKSTITCNNKENSHVNPRRDYTMCAAYIFCTQNISRSAHTKKGNDGKLLVISRFIN
jgi:hypothetical protein